MGRRSDPESELGGMHLFTIQAGCASIPWIGAEPHRVTIRTLCGTSGKTTKTIDIPLLRVSWPMMRGTGIDRSRPGIPSWYAYRPAGADDNCAGYLELLPVPAADFSAGWAFNEPK